MNVAASQAFTPYMRLDTNRGSPRASGVPNASLRAQLCSTFWDNVGLSRDADTEPIRIFVTRGKFDKEYDELTGQLYFKDSHLPEMLKLGRCNLRLEMRTLRHGSV